MTYDLSRVDPQLRDAVRSTSRTTVATGVARRIARLRAGYLSRVPRAQGVKITKVRSGRARMRLCVPDRPSGAGMLVIHGGGMVVGAAREADTFCTTVAARLGLTIASAEYRLAPEHPYPVPQDDCMALWTWLQDNADDLGVDRRRVVVGGGSAGGGLAASVVNAVRDAGGVQPVAQWLLYPMLDDRTAARTDLDGLDHFI